MDASSGDVPGVITVGVAQVPTDVVYIAMDVRFGTIVPIDALQIRVLPGGFCLADDQEPDNSRDDATTMSDNVSVAQFTQTLCPGTEDWFSVVVDSGRVLRVSLDADEGSVFSAELFAENVLKLRDTSPVRNKVLQETSAGARYFLRVFHTEPAGRASGTVRFETITP
ncbi:MAG: hypothetical protein R3C68_07995 [Myxococcota bacterium]